MSRYAVLRKLGLSKLAVLCYESLFTDGGATASQLADKLSQSRTGMYRVLRDMERQGFITCIKSTAQPAYFYAELIDRAILRNAAYRRMLVGQLIQEQAEIVAKRAGKTLIKI